MVNDAGRLRLLKLNARKTKLMVVGEENANGQFHEERDKVKK